jgi:transposase InsO family protein
VLVELGVVEQRYRAVLEVLEEGTPVTEVARRYGVARQTVHKWLARYANDGGLAGLADRSSRPHACPHQMLPAVEARIVGMRRAHPGWGPGRIVWERGRSMELWQMDVMGRVHLASGVEVKVVTGIDDHSRFIVCAKIVAAATARPVCQALAGALRLYGIPGQILTDNGKVFTARFGRGPGPVMFDRICTDNGIRHLLTAPYSPTTTGKVERLHKTMRAEFFTPKDRMFTTISGLQDALDGWVGEYNTARPHQSCGGRPPIERFRLANRSLAADTTAAAGPPPPRAPGPAAGKRPAGVSRWVNAAGKISLAGFTYRVGPSYAGQPVEVVVAGGLVDIWHAGVVVATHAQRLRADQAGRAPRARVVRRARDATAGLTVTRLADGAGVVSFAGTSYAAGRMWARTAIDVSIVAGSVQLSKDGKLIRVHPIRHDRSRELGAFANPKGRPRRKNSATGNVA